MPRPLTKSQRARKKRHQRQKKLREVAQGLRPLKGNAVKSKFGQQLLARRAQMSVQSGQSSAIPQLHSAESLEHDMDLDDFQDQLDQRIARMAQELHTHVQGSAVRGPPTLSTTTAVSQSDFSSLPPTGPHGDAPSPDSHPVEVAVQTLPDESVLFCLPRPAPSHEFLELVRSSYPSPRYVPFTAFVSDTTDDFEHPCMPIREFNGAQDPLSNFFPVSLIFEQHRHDSAEHAYQWFKAMYCKRPKLAQEIMQAPLPLRAKQLAKKLYTAPLLDEFRKVKVQFMARLLEHKYVQCPEFRKALLPGQRYVETTRDTFWGCGQTQEFRKANPNDRATGLNKLGKMMSRLAHHGTLLKANWRDFCIH